MNKGNRVSVYTYHSPGLREEKDRSFAILPNSKTRQLEKVARAYGIPLLTRDKDAIRQHKELYRFTEDSYTFYSLRDAHSYL